MQSAFMQQFSINNMSLSQITILKCVRKWCDTSSVYVEGHSELKIIIQHEMINYSRNITQSVRQFH